MTDPSGIPEWVTDLNALMAGEALEVGTNDRGEATARLDPERAARQGLPEVILAPGKGDRLQGLVESMLAATGSALISRLDPLELERLEDWAGDQLQVRRYGRSLVLRSSAAPLPEVDGEVHLLCAGTSDLPVVEEARMLIDAVGLRSRLAADCGVAGLHRLREPIAAARAHADVVVVAAGMDGALPSVVSGLLAIPVVGLPVSTGYGLGGSGVAALLSMLQTCAPGLSVVNIDNGVGAGASAARIALGAARARRGA